jgi:LPS-assembly protein
VPTRTLRDFASLVLAAAALSSGSALAQSNAAPVEESPLILRGSTRLSVPARGDQVRQRSVVVRADRLQSRPELDTIAEGEVEFRRAGTVVRADRLSYEDAADLVTARGNVRISRDGNLYRGPELQLELQRFEGFFLQPEFVLGQTGAGGRAARIDFAGSARASAVDATYTSCPRDGSGDPDWLLTTDRVRFDLETNEGVAEGAVLRFLGVPILALPVLSFPLSDDRKSGWLPPNVALDSTSGVEVAVPYYWNIAPNRDATIAPALLTRRGARIGAELRYLEQHDQGRIAVNLLPNDRVAGRSRSIGVFDHDGSLEQGIGYSAHVTRVSDDDYWKDFQRQIPALTPRLLPLTARVEGRFDTAAVQRSWYVGVQRWQILQSGDATTAVEAPYDRTLQLGARASGALWPGLNYDVQTELNRFTYSREDATSARPTGLRWHALGDVSMSWDAPGWWIRPKLALNAAAYSLDQPLSDGRTSVARAIPTFSVDSGAVFERESRWFGRTQFQTLEPRLLYANTPYRAQSTLPIFDTAPNDFNAVSAYWENLFSGIDRVADGHQLTAGVTTRLLDADTGAENLRLGISQRYLFRDQLVTPDGVPLTQRFSDVLFEGSTAVVPDWRFEVALRYSAETSRALRSIIGARYLPAPFHALSATYRFARGLSEQIELGWQWPVYRGSGSNAGSSRCQGSLYAVGRVNYSLRDSRVTDSIAGVEYDAGCWIGRIVGERLSTGRSEATTRLLIQLELVGLSRLGTNPLKVLKDNIPGYRLLRDERSGPYEPVVND